MQKKRLLRIAVLTTFPLSIPKFNVGSVYEAGLSVQKKRLSVYEAGLSVQKKRLSM